MAYKYGYIGGEAFFMFSEFKDKKNRTIRLEECGETIRAYHVDGDEKIPVGMIQFDIKSHGDIYVEEKTVAHPEIAHVDPAYQKSGIATEIIKYAKTLYDDVSFYPDTGAGGMSGEIHYSDQGLALKESCERQGITRAAWDDED